MDLSYVAITVLAAMIFVLAGMVGYLYWQQTHMLQHLQSLAFALAAHVEQIRQVPQHEEVIEEEEDDRLSVEPEETKQEEEVELVQGPPTATSDIDDYQSKTAAELRELLTQKGIPFGKRDSKTTLIELLKAVA